MAAVTLEQVTKRFRSTAGTEVTAVDALSLAIEEGEWVALAGPSGCGKTTVLRLVVGLDSPDGGTVRIGAKNADDLPARERDVGMVFQAHALYPHFTAAENIGFGLRVRGVSRSEAQARIRECAVMLGLEDCLERLPGELSGGQCQRVAMARALARRPSILLLDEPLSNLDVPLRRQLLAQLISLRPRLKTSCIYVTHDQSEAMAIGDRLGIMTSGRLLQCAPPQEIYSAPANLEVARFVGFPPINCLSGTLKADAGSLWFIETSNEENPTRIQLTGPTVQRLGTFVDRSLVLGLRPEAVRLGPAATGLFEQAPDGLVLIGTGKIDLVQRQGPETHVHFNRGANPFVARVAGEAPVAPGESGDLWLDLSRAVFFDGDTGRRLF